MIFDGIMYISMFGIDNHRNDDPVGHRHTFKLFSNSLGLTGITGFRGAT